MKEIRCNECGKLLAKVKKTGVPKYFTINIKENTITEIDKPHEEPKFKFEDFELEIKCPRCGRMNTNKGECQDGS